MRKHLFWTYTGVVFFGLCGLALFVPFSTRVCPPIDVQFTRDSVIPVAGLDCRWRVAAGSCSYAGKTRSSCTGHVKLVARRNNASLASRFLLHAKSFAPRSGGMREEFEEILVEIPSGEEVDPAASGFRLTFDSGAAGLRMRSYRDSANIVELTVENGYGKSGGDLLSIAIPQTVYSDMVVVPIRLRGAKSKLPCR